MANRLTDAVENAAMQAVAGRVGDLVTSLWDHSFGLVVNLLLLPRNAEGLTEEMQKLRALGEDLSNRAEREREEGTLLGNETEVINQLSLWMERVASLSSEFSRFRRSFEDLSLCIPRIICLGYNAAELLRRARSLIEEGNALPQTGLVRQLGPVANVALPSDVPSSSQLVGDKAALRIIQDRILDDAVGVVGIWGMGGVGKTTLLKIINNEFLIKGEAKGKFEVAIWVTVSKDGDPSTVREALCRRLGLAPESEKGVLFRELSRKRFILLLDDVWERLDLVEIGIPLPCNVNSGCKILFTTRYEHICGEMDADEMVNVGLLDAAGSWELFQSRAGRAAATSLNKSDIRPLAEEVVSRCGGLPISLVTVGRAMARARTRHDWQDAIYKLDHCAAELSAGMHQVLTSLRYSFDMLRDDTLRSCLLYCALFPEDRNIEKEDMVECWVGEGLLDTEGCDEYDIDQTRNRGHALITELQDACLLEEGIESDDVPAVKLHDTVRDMALWIASQEYVVLAGGVGTTRVPKADIWRCAKRISFAYNYTIREPPYSSELHYPNLTTLLLPGSGLLGERVPDGFFTHMPALRVLDLGDTLVEEFPMGITCLVQLQHLNLGYTGISSLPVELGKLTNLRQLLLAKTRSLTWIPREAITPLPRLQVLDLYGSGYVFGRDHVPAAAAAEAHVILPQQLELSDLENSLKRIDDVSLDAVSGSLLDVLAASNVLRGCVRKLRVQFARDDSARGAIVISRTIGHLWKLRALELRDCGDNPVEGDLLGGLHPDQLPDLEALRISDFKKARMSVGTRDRTISVSGLRRLEIYGCHGFSELTWAGHLPCLEKLCLVRCDGVTELLLQRRDGGSGGGGGQRRPCDIDHEFTPPFLKLKTMFLGELPSLRSISTHPLLLPCLEFLEVYDCPELKRLPLGPESAKNIREIRGEREWWDALEWPAGDGNCGADQGSMSVESTFPVQFTDYSW